jgi:hypothetical protein
LSDAAKAVARSLARHAYRRPALDAEVETLAKVFDLGQANKLSYGASLRLMLKAILVSPQFLFITPGKEAEAGKAIGTTLMTYGPALAARAFDVPNEARERAADGERSESALRDIAGKLELILQELQSQRGAAASDA